MHTTSLLVKDDVLIITAVQLGLMTLLVSLSVMMTVEILSHGRTMIGNNGACLPEMEQKFQAQELIEIPG